MNEHLKHAINLIKGFLTNNLGLKVLAVVFAVVLWLMVVTIDDPAQTRNFTATVTLKNENVLTQSGKYFTLPAGNTVTFRVTARRKTIEELSGSDFKATADFRRLEDDRRVPIDIETKEKNNGVTISPRKHYLPVLVGENTESSFKIVPTTTGDVGEGFEVGTITTNPDVLYVGGPAQVVSKIQSVGVTCDATGKTESFSDTAVPKLYDAAGVEMDMAGLTMSAISVVVNVELLSVQEVPITVETRGELPASLELQSITTVPSSIRLKGKPDQLNSLTTLSIPPEVINLSELTDDFETTIDIQSYLPKGVSIVNGESTQVLIKVALDSEQSREFRVNTSNLAVRNLSRGLAAEFEKKTVKVLIRGMETALSNLESSSITGSVDASGLGEGEHLVSVSLDLDEGLFASKVATDIIVYAMEPPNPDDKKDPSKTKTKNTQNVHVVDGGRTKKNGTDDAQEATKEEKKEDEKIEDLNEGSPEDVSDENQSPKVEGEDGSEEKQSEKEASSDGPAGGAATDDSSAGEDSAERTSGAEDGADAVDSSEKASGDAGDTD